jgi:protein TonB
MPSLKNPKADLRSKYSRYLKVGLIVALTSTIIAFKLSPELPEVEIKIQKPEPPIGLEPPIRTAQKPETPQPPKASELIAASIEDTPEDIILNDIDDYKPAKLPDKPPSKPKIIEDYIIFEVVEEMPAPVGGLKAIQEKVHFTEIARRAGVEGTVYIQAKINKNGDVVDATVIKGLGAGLDEEALNAVLATKFIPGKQRGKPVNVKMVIPIKFVLK